MGFEVVDPGSDDAVWAMGRYFGELAERLATGFDVAVAAASSVTAYRPPNGLFLVARVDGVVVACGGVQWLDDTRGEIKRMWVDPSTRGTGLGRRMLERLEQEIAASGRTIAVLDTNSALTAAIAMYRRCGYVEVDPYNDNPDAELWFEKPLASTTAASDLPASPD